MDQDLFDGDDEDADTFATLTAARLERLLVMLRQTISASGGGTNLNMHDRDGQLHFSFEGQMPHAQEKTQ